MSVTDDPSASPAAARQRASRNLDASTVESFGREWSKFDQSGLSDEEARAIFDEYFAIFPWDALPKNATGFDMGCGSGRWARFVAPRVGRLHCIDPSIAIEIARKNLQRLPNVSFHQASVGDDVLPENSQDFGYSLGVLHHVPDTLAAIRSCVALLKPGAPFLVYLYYALDNRPAPYRWLWKASNLLRVAISELPALPKNLVTDLIAMTTYWPLARLAKLGEKGGMQVRNWPLAYYRDRSWYTMRTDSRDRFGTPLEKRFAREQVQSLMADSGLIDIRFSESAPYWCCVGRKP